MKTPGRFRLRGVDLALVVILGVAVLVRIALAFQMGNRFYFADTVEYEEAARSILAGHGPGPNFPRAPLYPAFMALGILLGGTGNYFAARGLQVLIGVGIVVLTIVLARRLGSPTRGLLAGAAAAIAPTLVFTSAMLYPTALYTLLLLAATIATLDLDAQPTVGRALRLGMVMTLGWLTDQVIMAVLLVLLLWLLTGVRRGGRKLVAMTSLAFAVMVVLAAPWVRYHERTYGRSAFFMDKAQYVLWVVRSHPDLVGAREIQDTTSTFHPLRLDAFLTREGALLRARPAAYLADYTEEFVHFFQPMPDRVQTRNRYNQSGYKLIAAIYFVPVLMLFCFGILIGPPPFRRRALLALVPLATGATYALFFTQTRYRIPVEPEMLVLAALAVEWLFPHTAARMVGAPEAPESPTSKAAVVLGIPAAR